MLAQAYCRATSSSALSVLALCRDWASNELASSTRDGGRSEPCAGIIESKACSICLLILLPGCHDKRVNFGGCKPFLVNNNRVQARPRREFNVQLSRWNADGLKGEFGRVPPTSRDETTHVQVYKLDISAYRYGRAAQATQMAGKLVVATRRQDVSGWRWVAGDNWWGSVPYHPPLMRAAFRT